LRPQRGRGASSERIPRLLKAVRIDVNQHLRTRERLPHLDLDLLSDRVRVEQRQLRIELEVKLDELGRSRGARAHVVVAENGRMTLDDRLDAPPLAAGQLAVEQHVERLGHDLLHAPENQRDDEETENRIEDLER